MSYQSKLSLIETQKAIKSVKVFFEEALCSKLNLIRISPPLFVDTKSGLNDDLNGFEKPVSFDVKSGISVSVVQSLAKWKRMALKKYDFQPYTGLYANMNAIRKDEDLGPMHSYYVDQWDWEKVIQAEDRTIEFLQSIVKDIYTCFKLTEDQIVKMYPQLSRKLPDAITFIGSQEMEEAYPQLAPKDRETKYTEKYGAVFVSQVGKTLKSGGKHDGRAPDYDDWDLNGDILVHDANLQCAFELSSMGIRVSKESLVSQLRERGVSERLSLPFHQALANGELPDTVGGGIGQSRLCMYLLDKAHIGEVQVSVWDEKNLVDCEAKNIKLL